MTTNHTPGPWAVDNLTVRWGSYFVADCVVADCDIGRQGECQANARLIAAAPDLLAALRLLVIACTQDVAPDGYVTLEAPDRNSMRDAIFAIQKATGGAA
jgi:hypothetical protein